jgi:hypothetical protein
MLDPHNMSTAEKQFIRVYVAAMHREYDMLHSMFHLMSPTETDVKSVVVAAKMARSLREMHAEFDSTLHELSRKHKFRAKQLPPLPNLDDLADLFTLSFFKIIKTSGAGQIKKDDGWFSGDPSAWGKTIKSAFNANYSSLPKVLSAYLQSLKNLLSNETTLDIKNKFWKLPSDKYEFADYFEQSLDGQYDDELNAYDDDEDEDDFLNWFYGNDTDDDED